MIEDQWAEQVVEAVEEHFWDGQWFTVAQIMARSGVPLSVTGAVLRDMHEHDLLAQRYAPGPSAYRVPERHLRPAGCEQCRDGRFRAGGYEGHPSQMRCDATGVHRLWCLACRSWRPCVGEPMHLGFLSL